jgi:hypothetical protein
MIKGAKKAAALPKLLDTIAIAVAEVLSSAGNQIVAKSVTGTIINEPACALRIWATWTKGST